MAWTNLTFSAGAILTSANMNNMQANFAAMADGDAGAPNIVTAALTDGAVTYPKINFSNEIVAGDIATGAAESSMQAITAGDTYYHSYKGVGASNTTSAYSSSPADGWTCERSGTYRFSFYLYATLGGTTTGRIYKNGVAFGTEQSTTATSSELTATEDLTVASGDYLELRVKNASSNTSVAHHLTITSAQTLLG